VAKAKGHLRGKQPKLSKRQEAHLVSLIHSGDYSTAEVAELFGVGRSTVYRAIERQRAAAQRHVAAASCPTARGSRMPHPSGTPTRNAETGQEYSHALRLWFLLPAPTGQLRSSVP
jgi:hypothetical protein